MRGLMPQDGEPSPPTDEERRAFRAALAASRAFAVVLFGLVAAAVLLRLPESWWVPAVGFVAVAGLLFRLANWKCPACGERLPTRGGRVCHGCGAPLDE